MKCPYCNSVFTYLLHNYPNGKNMSVSVYRCFNCQANIKVEHQHTVISGDDLMKIGQKLV